MWIKSGVSGRIGAVLLLLGIGAGYSHALVLRSFGDVTYNNTRRTKTADPNHGASLGQLDFFATEQISDRMDALAEFVIESPGAGFVLDLERLEIGYRFHDSFQLRAGRFHNLLGYWNGRYHHGAQMQTTVGRPFFLEFEDGNGVLPVHMVGMFADGNYGTPAGRIGLGVMAGNGSSITGSGTGAPVELNPNSAGDSDNGKAVSARLSGTDLLTVSGLGLGVFGNFSRVAIANVGGSIADDNIKQEIYGFDLTYLANNIEFLNEYYRWNNTSKTLAKKYNKSSAFYTQMGYLIDDRFKPYVRYEILDARSDPYFDAVGMTAGTNREKKIVVAGLRYDLNAYSAIKAEYRSTNDDVDGKFNSYHIQWSFAFQSLGRGKTEH